VRAKTIAFIIDCSQKDAPTTNNNALQTKTKQDAQKGQTSHPPNPGGYFTRPP
jgi:hypothetical protein